MALTEQQNIPEKPRVSEPWTFKRLFSLGAVTTITKTFTNPFDILLGFLILTSGIIEIIGQHISWLLFALNILILLAALFERHANLLSNTKSRQTEIK